MRERAAVDVHFVHGVGDGVVDAFARRVEDADFQPVAEQHFRPALRPHRLAAHRRPAREASLSVPGRDGVVGVVFVVVSRLGLDVAEGGAPVAHAGAGHVDFAEGALVFGELPLAEEAEAAHAEGEDGGYVRRGGEEGGGVQDGAVAAEGGDQVDFGVEGGEGRGVGGGWGGGEDGEGEGGVDCGGDVGFEDEGEVGVGGVDMAALDC